jgi:hypothetical protein
MQLVTQRFCPWACRLMASIFKTPVALVALIESDQLWFKSVAGPFGSCIKRQGSLCDHILVPDSAEVLFVEDLAADARFASSPLVCGDPFVRFYAGAPLLGSAGHRYGTLCVLDIVPRMFEVSLISCLVNFAELVVRELERTAAMAKDESLLLSLGPLSRSKESFLESVALVDVGTEGWNIMYANSSWAKELGFGLSGAVSDTFWSYFHPVNADTDRIQQIEQAMRTSQPFLMSVQIKNSNVLEGLQSIVFRPVTDSLAQNIPVGIPSFVPFDSNQPMTEVKISSETKSSHLSSPKDLPEGKNLWFATLRRESLVDSPDINALESRDLRLTPPRPSSTVSGSRPYSHVPQTPCAEAPSITLLSQASSSSNELYPYDLVPPEAFKSLVLGPILGTGAIARVHRATWRGENVAVKIIEVLASVSWKNDLDDAIQESKLSMKMFHPNVVRTIEFDTARYGMDSNNYKPSSQLPLQMAESVWLVQELCDHGRLYDALDRGWLKHSPTGTPNMEFILRTCLDITGALAYMHSHSLVHGDLTGNNVLLTTNHDDSRGFIARVGDFGLCKVLMNTVRQTQRYGTVSHMPPETLEHGHISPATDIYSFGVLQWEMWNGIRAYCGQRPAQIIIQVTCGKTPLTFPATAPEEFVRLSKKCMSPVKEERPTAEEACLILSSMMEGLNTNINR